MRGRVKAASALALLCLAALAGCGEEDPGQDATATTTQATQAPNGSAAAPGNEGGAEGFAPKPHSDSGGGAEQFLRPGADNSVQETGEEASAEDFEQGASALHGFLDARAQRAWAAACGYLTAGLATSLQEGAAQGEGGEGEPSCAAGLEAFTRPAGIPELRREAERADVGSVRVEGESGFVIYRVGEVVYALAIAREDGEWKVAALAGYPLL